MLQRYKKFVIHYLLLIYFFVSLIRYDVPFLWKDLHNSGQSIGKATNIGQCSSDDINGLLGGKIKEQSAFCTDGNSVYRKLSKDEDLNLIPLKGGKAKKGIYHIQHINSYHSELKRFLGFFKGVSTKYLNNYIVWNSLVNCVDCNPHREV